MKTLTDYCGRRFGSLTVIERAHAPEGLNRRFWLCRCECGRDKIAETHALTSGRTTSCGCGQNRGAKKSAKLLGKRFGFLTVLERRGSQRVGNGTHALWRCRCDCGNETIVPTLRLNSGVTRSCGCRSGNITHGHNRNRKPTPTLSSWKAMVGRCTQPSNPAFAHYQKRGITVCDRWLHGEDGKSGFECFLDDVGERPSLEFSLDRFPDNDGGYEPGNVRWATKKEQANNRVTNKWFDYKGERVTFAQLVDATGMDKELLRHRLLRAGWSLEDAIAAPKQRGQRTDISQPRR